MSQIIYPITHLPTVIDIGKQTEKGVTRIGFDVHEWLDDWPGMAFSVQPTRPGETESYFAASEMVGSVVFWLVGAVDTEKPGSGTVEVLGVTEDERKLSFMCRTSIANTNTATVAEVPEPNQPWVDRVILAADSAAKSATESEAFADNAAASAKEAEESVKDFFIVKTPFILNANPQKTDKTQAEIIEAIEAGKVCMLVATLYNRVYDSASIEDGAPVFRRYGFDNKTNKSFAETVTVNADDTVTSFYTEPILTPSPGVLHFRGAVNASYNGDKHVTVEIPSGGAGLPETADPLKQLVTDESGKVAWEDRLAYKTTAVAEVVNLEETAPTYDETDACFYLLSPWVADLMAGDVATVKYNGTDYECKAVDGKAIQPDAPTKVVAMGNLAAMGLEGIEGSNPNAPFVLVAMPNGDLTEGLYAMLIPLDGATAATLSVTSKQTRTTIKTIDPEFLPPNAKRKTIILTFDDDGNLTSDTDFETAWAMDAAQLQAAIVIADTGLLTTGYSGPRSSASYQVTKAEAVSSGVTLRQIQIQYGKKMLDLSDAPLPCTYYIDWTNYGGEIALTKSSFRQQGMPIDAGNISAGMYLRHSGSGWVAVTIDQLKADLGLA